MDKWEDKIVAEVRQVREQYAEQFGFDVAAICRDLRERQEEGGRRVVRLDAKKTASRSTAVE
jgi:hypothetical protein